MLLAVLATTGLVTSGVVSGTGAVAQDEPALVAPAPRVQDPQADVTEAESSVGWIDPTLPDVLLGKPVEPPLPNGSEAPLVADPQGTTKPERGAEAEEQRRTHADAAPPMRPGFVDDYTRLWQSIESGLARVKRLKGRMAEARFLSEAASGDLRLAMRVRQRTESEHESAAENLDTAVKDLYISGTTDVGVVIGVLGTQPDDMLDALDSVIYLRAATNDADREYRSTRSAAVKAQSATASAMITLDQARQEAESAQKALTRARSQLDDAREELDRLIAAAAPQTVVGPSGCPKAVLDGTVPAGLDIRDLCKRAVKGASTPQAAFAIKWALVRLGAPYACDGVGRLAPWRYDCSSYVSRAYAEGAGLATAASTWAPSTRNMLPWDGAELDPHYARIEPGRIEPGDLVLYDTCPAGEECPYRHVVMYLGPVTPGGVAYMAHTNECGSVAHVAAFWGTDAANFLGVRRVMPASGEQVKAPKGALVSPVKGRASDPSE